MRSSTLNKAVVALFFTTSILLAGSSYSYEKDFVSKYDKRLKENPNYKLNVRDLDIQKDIDDDSIFCYSTVSTPKAKMQKLIEGLRLLPIECNGGADTSGNYECLLENEVLDTTAKENSIDAANGNTSKSFKDRASENGYNGEFVVGSLLIQNGTSESAMIKMVENKMKSDANFCSYIVGKKRKDLGVAYEDANGKRYWSVVLGDEK